MNRLIRRESVVLLEQEEIALLKKTPISLFIVPFYCICFSISDEVGGTGMKVADFTALMFFLFIIICFTLITVWYTSYKKPRYVENLFSLSLINATTKNSFSLLEIKCV